MDTLADHPLRIYIFGRLAIESGPHVVREAAFPARQGRRLWAYLVLRRQWPVGREDLASAVWGEYFPDAWDTSLSALVSRLRAMLAPIARDLPALTIRGEVGQYQLIVPQGTVIDSERARAALHSAETALRQGQLGAALGEARVAMEIAARGFLGNDDLPWIRGERQFLAQLRVRALECTVEAELARGNADLAQREAEHLVLLDPLYEPGYRLLMRALAAHGNVAHIPRVMEQCRRALHESAGIAPSPATQHLFDELIRPR
jgi:DNA-binding SARP family transcriptional activator